jgi:hypothetical protein
MKDRHHPKPEILRPHAREIPGLAGRFLPTDVVRLRNVPVPQSRSTLLAAICDPAKFLIHRTLPLSAFGTWRATIFVE